MIILTSFKASVDLPLEIPRFSVARWQPKGFTLPELSFLAATGAGGEKLLLSQFADPVAGYAEALRAGYQSRWDLIRKWLDSLKPAEHAALCCWCPYSGSSKSQVKEHGTFACHTGLIGQMICKHRPDIEVVLDVEREKHLLPEWRPKAVAKG